MFRKRFWLGILLCLGMITEVSAQVIIEGKIQDAMTGAPLPFASIQVLGGDGYISNEDGRFRLNLISPTETIDFSYVGYFPKRVLTDSGTVEIMVQLEPKSFELKEFTIRESAFDFAWTLIKEMRSALKKSGSQESKAYLELFTNRYREPVEIAELYYNARQEKGSLQELTYKTGRIGLMRLEGGYFVSLSSSRVFQELELLKNSNQLPDHPFHMSRNAVKSNYDLKVAEYEYGTQGERSYILYFEPRKMDGTYFSGEAHIQGNNLEKVVLYISNAGTYPFIPLIPGDSLSDVAMQVEFRFRPLESGLVMSILRFNYGFNYFLKLVDAPQGRIRTTPSGGKPSYQASPVISDGFCYFFDFDQPFYEPHYRYGADLNDYQKMLNTPTNHYFWERTDPLVKSERFLDKEAFFRSNGTLHNFAERDSVVGRMESIFYHSNVFWSDTTRLQLNLIYANQDMPGIKENRYIVPERQKYNLDVQLFLDYTELEGEGKVVNSCVFDVFNSYYYAEPDSLTDAFLNIHFDICEKNRRSLDKAIADLNLITPDQVELIYIRWEKRMQDEMEEFIDESDSGNDYEVVKKWNKRVSVPLGVDNLEVFELEEH